jgi:hypothetical protein
MAYLFESCDEYCRLWHRISKLKQLLNIGPLPSAHDVSWVQIFAKCTSALLGKRDLQNSRGYDDRRGMVHTGPRHACGFPNSVHNKAMQKSFTIIFFIKLFISNQNYIGFYKLMKMKMYAILDKTKLHTENIKGLNLATVIYTTVQVSRLLRYSFRL